MTARLLCTPLRGLCLFWRAQGNDDAAKRFQEVSRAYDALRDPQKRAQYDQMGPDGYERMAESGGGAGPFGGQVCSTMRALSAVPSPPAGCTRRGCQSGGAWASRWSLGGPTHLLSGACCGRLQRRHVQPPDPPYLNILLRIMHCFLQPLKRPLCGDLRCCLQMLAELRPAQL